MSEIEKQFFETFGIEQKFKGYSNTEELSNGGVIPCGNIKYFDTIEEMDKANYWCFNMWELDEEDKDYPQITDRILLELICIINQIYLSDYGEEDYYVSSNYKDLKQEIISQCNRLANKNAILETHGEDFKQQVQALFKENN